MKKLLVVLMVLAFMAPAAAMADDQWDMYGSARVAFFYEDYDKDASGITNAVTGNAVDDLDLNMFLQGNSRVGAKVKVSDQLSGRFEFSSAVSTRLLYGAWNFGGGTFIVGQDYTPFATFYSNQVAATDTDLLGYGFAYDGRQPQLKLKMGGFQVALIQNAQTTDAAANPDVVLPKIALAYDMKMDTFNFGVYGGYQSFTAGQDGADWDVDSYVLGLRAKGNFGPAYVGFNAFYAQNAGDYGLSLGNATAGSLAGNAAATEDATTYQAAVVVGAKISNALKVEGGFGYGKNQRDLVGAAGDTEVDYMSYYVQLPITLAPGVFITPEISVFDFGDTDTTGTASVDNGQAIFYGAKFQINF